MSKPIPLAVAVLMTFIFARDTVVGEADGSVDLRLQLTQASSEAVTVRVTSAEATAAVGTGSTDDVRPVDSLVTFMPGQTTASVPISIVDDNFDTRDTPREAFFIDLTEIENATAERARTVIEIIDDDPVVDPVTISVDDVVVSENDGLATLAVRLNGKSDEIVSLSVSTASGTAISGQDFEPLSRNIILLPGQTAKTVDVPILDDSQAETSERFQLVLSEAENGELIRNSANIVIAKNDQQPKQTPTLSVDNVTVSESDNVAWIPLQFDAPATTPVSVAMRAISETAAVGTSSVSDVWPLNEVITFEAGETFVNVPLVIIDDSFTTRDTRIETVRIEFTAADGLDLGSNTTIVTIVDDEGDVSETPFAEIQGPVRVSEADGVGDISINLLGPSNVVPEYILEVGGGTATRGVDYIAPEQQLVRFAAFDTSNTVLFDILDDSELEGDETFLVRLRNAGDGALVSESTVTIEDDENGFGQNPVAEDDFGNTTEVTAIVLDVISNDRDDSEVSLVIDSLGTPDNGSVRIVDNQVEYTPDTGFAGRDTFTYTIADGNGETDTATVTVTVTAVGTGDPTPQARVFLTADGDFILSNSAEVFGRSGGEETVRLASEAQNVTLDGNIERVELADDLSATTFEVVDGQLTISVNGTPITTFAGGLNQEVTLQFGNGEGNLQQSGAASFTLSGPDGQEQIGTEPVTPDIRLGGEPDAITSADDGRTFDAGAGDKTFDFSDGTYGVTVNNFATGDVLNFADVGGSATASVNVLGDTDQSDGEQQLTATDPNDGSTLTVTLVGLSSAQDSAIFSQSSFESEFGSGSIGL